MTTARASLCVAVCTNRVENLDRVVGIARSLGPADTLLVVVDLADNEVNYDYLHRLQSAGAEVLRNHSNRGLSFSRNRALDSCVGDFMVFVDDDVSVEPIALDAIGEAAAAGAGIVGVSLEPGFQPGFRRRWWLTPGQFHYLGVHQPVGPRSTWGACMGIDMRLVREHSLRFRSELGRKGGGLQSGDDTTFLDELRRLGADEVFLTSVSVTHEVAPRRVSPGYLLRRAWWQGRSEVRRQRGATALLKEWRRNSTSPHQGLVRCRDVLVGQAYVAAVVLGEIYELASALLVRGGTGADQVVLLASDVTVRGGVDKYIEDLLLAAHAREVTCHLALEETSTSALCNSPLVGRLAHRHLVPLYRQHGERSLRTSASALLAAVRPDVVHVVCGSPWSCMTLREVVVEAGVPLVITEQHVADDLDLKSNDVTRVRASYRGARRVICVSEGNRRTLDRVVGLEGIPVEVIPNAVDVTGIGSRADSLRAAHRSPAGRSAVAVARYSHEKWLEGLIQAVAQLPETLLSSVDIYGDGPMRSKLTDQVRTLGLEDRVILHGWVEDIVPALASHDVFVLCSRSEGMSFALLEAMSAGTPVVATNVSGTLEALDGGACGTMCDVGDVDGLASALRTSLTARQDVNQMARRARERAAERYDVEEQMRRTTAVWGG